LIPKTLTQIQNSYEFLNIIGQEIIKLYYQWSPVIVKVMEEDEEFKGGVKEMIDGVLMLIGEK
jgi:hypothetical protein